MTVVIVGGGAAGIFAAIACAENNSQQRTIVLEKSRQLLAKVRISGGGRCNVTHACFDPGLLVKNYPRGSRELRGPFSRFQPRDTIEWFDDRGVPLKTEQDGRMFPVTDSSETIINCLLHCAEQAGVEILLEKGVKKIERDGTTFRLTLSKGEMLDCDRLLLAMGSSREGLSLAQSLGHKVVPPVSSLFTFNLPDSPFLDLAGISLEASVKLPQFGLEQKGPVLFTHWGFSGPAVLKLSAWAARALHSVDYRTTVLLNWLPSHQIEEIKNELRAIKEKYPSRLPATTDSLFKLPKQLWRKLVAVPGISEEMRWAQLSRQQLEQLAGKLQNCSFDLRGKTTYKNEFVTCGGIALEEVNFKTMESRLVPGLYFAGEILDIDGVTGGFNFQNAWTTGWIAGRSLV
jgi:predicted Rossmann fold flavoprotein